MRLGDGSRDGGRAALHVRAAGRGGDAILAGRLCVI